jgi:hypothetical protein
MNLVGAFPAVAQQLKIARLTLVPVDLNVQIWPNQTISSRTQKESFPSSRKPRQNLQYKLIIKNNVINVNTCQELYITYEQLSASLYEPRNSKMA